MRRRWFSRRRAAWFGGIAFVLWWVAGLLGAHIATNARPFAVLELAELGGRPVVTVATRATDGVAVRGWLVRANDASTEFVVLAARHPRQSSRDARTRRVAHGWSVPRMLAGRFGSERRDHFTAGTATTTIRARLSHGPGAPLECLPR